MISNALGTHRSLQEQSHLTLIPSWTGQSKARPDPRWLEMVLSQSLTLTLSLSVGASPIPLALPLSSSFSHFITSEPSQVPRVPLRLSQSTLITEPRLCSDDCTRNWTRAGARVWPGWTSILEMTSWALPPPSIFRHRFPPSHSASLAFPTARSPPTSLSATPLLSFLKAYRGYLH